MKIILSATVIVLLSSVSAKPSDTKLNCFIKHLKSIDKLEAGFPLLGSGKLEDDCSDIVDTHQEIFYSTLFGIANSSNSDAADCIVDASIELNLADDVYKAQHYDYLMNVNQTSNSVKHELILEIESTLKAALKSCQLRNLDYQKYLEDPRSYLKAYEGVRAFDFCMRKIYLERHPASQNFDSNPFNLKVGDIDCVEIAIEFSCKTQYSCKKYNKLSSCLTFTKGEQKNMERFSDLAVLVQLNKNPDSLNSTIDRFFEESLQFEKDKFVCSFASHIFYNLGF